jgi:hypothetical protein
MWRGCALLLAQETAPRSHLDVAGLKTQVLGRIEELEAQVQEGGAAGRGGASNGGAGARHRSREGADGRVKKRSLSVAPREHGGRNVVSTSIRRAGGSPFPRSGEQGVYRMLDADFGESYCHALGCIA